MKSDLIRLAELQPSLKDKGMFFAAHDSPDAGDIIHSELIEAEKADLSTAARNVAHRVLADRFVEKNRAARDATYPDSSLDAYAQHLRSMYEDEHVSEVDGYVQWIDLQDPLKGLIRSRPLQLSHEMFTLRIQSNDTGLAVWREICKPALEPELFTKIDAVVVSEVEHRYFDELRHRGYERPWKMDDWGGRDLDIFSAVVTATENCRKSPNKLKQQQREIMQYCLEAALAPLLTEYKEYGVFDAAHDDMHFTCLPQHAYHLIVGLRSDGWFDVTIFEYYYN